MYQAHFGLRELPFGITPDTSFAFSGTSHQEALNTLLVAASSGEGFTKITGEVGTGKTMLCRRFMAALDGGYVCAYLPNPLLEPKGLMHALAHELHLRVKARADLQVAIQQLGKSLLGYAEEDKRVLVCIDEAQASSPAHQHALALLGVAQQRLPQLLDRRLQVGTGLHPEVQFVSESMRPPLGLEQRVGQVRADVSAVERRHEARPAAWSSRSTSPVILVKPSPLLAATGGVFSASWWEVPDYMSA